jgi:hypothetical protein
MDAEYKIDLMPPVAGTTVNYIVEEVDLTRTEDNK